MAINRNRMLLSWLCKVCYYRRYMCTKIVEEVLLAAQILLLKMPFFPFCVSCTHLKHILIKYLKCWCLFQLCCESIYFSASYHFCYDSVPGLRQFRKPLSEAKTESGFWILYEWWCHKRAEHKTTVENWLQGKFCDSLTTCVLLSLLWTTTVMKKNVLLSTFSRFQATSQICCHVHILECCLRNTGTSPRKKSW